MTETTTPKRRKWRRRLWTGVKRTVVGLGLLLCLYLAIVLVGLIPVNRDFVQPVEGVELLLISSSVHADLVLPLRNEVHDWRAEFSVDGFAQDVSGVSHVMIGWGDTGFYVNTPTWSDLRCTTAAHALLWPSESCLHIGLTSDEFVRPHARSVRVSNEQYASLVAFVQSSFLRDAGGKKQLLPAAYGQADVFYAAVGHYHALNTCNSWIGRAMQAAGIRTPWLTPLPKTAFLYLPQEGAG